MNNNYNIRSMGQNAGMLQPAKGPIETHLLFFSLQNDLYAFYLLISKNVVPLQSKRVHSLVDHNFVDHSAVNRTSNTATTYYRHETSNKHSIFYVVYLRSCVATLAAASMIWRFCHVKKKEVISEETTSFVRRMRLELTRSCDHYPLKVACIPISPPAPRVSAAKASPPLAIYKDRFYVPRTGLEPARLATYAPETYASTNSATWARRNSLATRFVACTTKMSPRLLLFRQTTLARSLSSWQPCGCRRSPALFAQCFFEGCSLAAAGEHVATLARCSVNLFP